MGACGTDGIGECAPPCPLIDVTLEVATLVRLLGGVLVISPDGYLYFGDGSGDDGGMSDEE